MIAKINQIHCVFPIISSLPEHFDFTQSDTVASCQVYKIEQLQTFAKSFLWFHTSGRLLASISLTLVAAGALRRSEA